VFAYIQVYSFEVSETSETRFWCIFQKTQNVLETFWYILDFTLICPQIKPTRNFSNRLTRTNLLENVDNFRFAHLRHAEYLDVERGNLERVVRRRELFDGTIGYAQRVS